jgi:hypothetical protein
MFLKLGRNVLSKKHSLYEEILEEFGKYGLWNRSTAPFDGIL